jgi:hypothetical protein
MSNTLSSNRTVSPKEAKKSIRKCLKLYRAIFLWGPPGIGKSDIVHQIAAEQGRRVIDIRLTLWDPTDIKGIPYYNSDSKTMQWAPPEELPKLIDSDDILFLDELNSAAPATQAAAYQLILNRRVGAYQLPNKVGIVAAGNRENDKSVTYRMPAALANRFIHIEINPKFDDWHDWAVINKINPQVVGYLNFSKQDLFDFDPKSSSRAFPTPRSWSFVSELLDDDDGDEETLTDLISGSVGEGLAIKFMAHRKISKQMPDPSSILQGKVKDFNVKEISAMYSLTTSMCYELQEADQAGTKDWDKMADNFFAFIMSNFPVEIVVMGAKLALIKYQLPFDSGKMEHFDTFHDKYGHYIRHAIEADL